MPSPGHTWVTVPDGRYKTALLHELAIAGANEDLVRSTAIELMRGLRFEEHVRRLERIDRFVRAIPYFNESVEMFQPPTYTLTVGGDCDDHVLTKCALAWSLRYPFVATPAGDIREPFHYSCKLGYPPADHPWGEASTTWIDSESTIAGGWFGEHWRAAAVRHGGTP